MRALRPSWLIGSLVLSLLPARAGGVDTLADITHKVKAADGNLWSRRFRRGRLVRGFCNTRCIAFTFDDGPNWETTPRLLDALAQRNLRVTFFVTGHRIDGDGEVARRNREVLASAWSFGHLVGNHTYHHDLLDTMSEAQLTDEIDRTGRLIEGVLGERVYLFRAPYGALNHPRAVSAVFSREYTPVHWAMDSNDWRVNTPEAVLANVRAELDRSPHGGVLLMHDTLPWSVDAFPLILNEIDQRNAALMARGERPYELVGLERFYEALGPPARRRPARSR
ncbi:MAG: polysaccharide deacetylase family protein [Myxococcales bacterium]|nr:polysaccharide deacetylase family protein [Myxococcales bacterium]